MTGPSAVRWARRVGLAAAAAIGFYAVVAQWSEITDAVDQIGLTAALASFGMVLAGLAASALSWRALLADLGEPMSLGATTRVFFLGQLSKYLPGGIWPVVAQMELGHDAGAQRPRVATAAVVIMGVNVTTGLAVGAVCLPLSADDTLGSAAWFFALLPVGVIALHPRVLTALINWALTKLRQPTLSTAVTGRGVAGAAGWAAVMWGCYGAHVFLLAAPITADDERLILLSTGAFGVAWTVGFLTVIAPAGAAAREAMLVVAMSSALATAPATALALVSRALMTAGDLLWAGVGACVGGRRRAAPGSSRSARSS